MSGAAASPAVERFRAIILRGLGLAFDESKSGFLEDVLRQRAVTVGQTAEAYLARLDVRSAHGSSELRELARALTVGETYFFRNVEQFRALQEIALPFRVSVRAQGGQRALRLLSAGCSSGEEPYSLAIAVRERVDPTWDVQIAAVDVNPAAIERAARARYSTWALRETTPDLARRWFRTEGRDLCLDEDIRRAVSFSQHNLVEDDGALWHPESYDVVFCRNVLMYFAPEKARAVVARITKALAPGGYLFLGHAETLRGLSGDYHLRHTHETFYYQRKDVLGAPETDDIERAIGAPLAAAVDATSSWVEIIQRASDRIDVLTRAAAPAERPARERPDLAGVIDLLHAERYADALDRVSALPSHAAREPEALLVRAILLTHGGKLAEAERTCDEILEGDELNAGAHYALALCREAAGDRKGAIDHDQVAVYLDASFAMPRLHLGLLARKSGDAETAKRELGQAIHLLHREETARLLLFGGGFGRETLMALCRAELASCGGRA